jgi:cytochrome P450
VSLEPQRANNVNSKFRVGWENGLAFQGYTERFRAYRKAIQPSFGSESAVAKYTPLQEVETRRFLFRVLKDPKNLLQHVQTCVSLSTFYTTDLTLIVRREL